MLKYYCEFIFWVIEISSHVNNCSKGLLGEVQFRLSSLFVCVELIAKKYKSMTKWKGLLCALQEGLLMLVGFFFGFCLSQDLSSPRDITQSLFLLACNLLSEFYMISTVSILNSLGVC